ncbi:MAG: HupE/UreJ family protein [Chitinophagaceae bacterium]|jgi:hypothetical protein
MKLRLLFLLSAMLLFGVADGHTINYQLEKMDDKDVFLKYLLTGYEHIIPLGLDHILFILCVFFLNTDLKKIIIQASMFTLAHSITLALAVYGIIEPPGEIVEPLIALSIVILALENIFFNKVKPWRMLMIFLFGLIHGMGFAGALAELGIPDYAFASALVSFNVGVELGQITIILLMYLLVAKTMGKKEWYRRFVVIPSSLIIAMIAAYWTIERVFFN